MRVDAEGLAQLLGQPLAGAVWVCVGHEGVLVEEEQEVRALLQLLGPRLGAVHEAQPARRRLLQLLGEAGGAQVILTHKEDRVAL